MLHFASNGIHNIIQFPTSGHMLPFFFSNYSYFGCVVHLVSHYRLIHVRMARNFNFVTIFPQNYRQSLLYTCTLTSYHDLKAWFVKLFVTIAAKQWDELRTHHHFMQLRKRWNEHLLISVHKRRDYNTRAAHFKYNKQRKYNECMERKNSRPITTIHATK